MHGRFLVPALFCAALGGCGGTTTGASSAPPPTTALTDSTATPADFTGWSEFDSSITRVATGGGATATSLVLQFTDATAQTVGVTANGAYLGHFDWDAGRSAYVNGTTGATLYIHDSPNAPGVFTARLDYTDPDTSATQVGYSSLSNNNTTLADLPTSAKATYNGIVEASDNRNNVVGGTIGLNADFAGGKVSGAITIDKGTVFGAATFGIPATPIIELGTSTQSVAGFTGTLGGTDVLTSYLDGTFTGSTSSGTTAPPSVSGSFYVQGTPGSLAGAYSAAKQP